MKKTYRKDGFGDRKKKSSDYVRVNHQIRVPQVRVIQDKKQLGIMSTDEARNLAQQAGLDLVETVPNAKPPVCQIVEFSKFKWEREQQKKEQEKKNRNKQVELKEIRLSPVIDDNDVLTKSNAAKKFLEAGKKVKISLLFKKRQIVHKDIGMDVVKKFIENLKDVASPEKPPKYEAHNRLSCILDPIKPSEKK